MKKIIKNTFILLAVLGLVQCASTINTTGKIDFTSKIENVAVICTSPENVLKFSNDLCSSLKNELNKSGVEVTTKVISEMNPSFDSGEMSITTEQQANLVMTISHERISITYGKPSGTLMLIELIDPINNKKIWAAKMSTLGSNVTGPGNSEKVAAEIVEKMKADGLKL